MTSHHAALATFVASASGTVAGLSSGRALDTGPPLDVSIPGASSMVSAFGLALTLCVGPLAAMRRYRRRPRLPQPHRGRVGQLGQGLLGEAAQTSQSKGSSIALLVVVAALYGTLGICMRELYSLTGPPTPSTVSLIRQVITVLIFVPLLAAGSASLKATASTSTLPMEALPKGFWTTGLELAFWNAATQGLMNAGLACTDATRASFFVQFSVAITPVFAFLSGQAVPRAVWGGCAAALVGVLLLGADGAAEGTSTMSALLQGFNLGDLMCLASAATWSAYILRLGVLSRQGLPPVQLQAAKTLLLCPFYAAWMVADWLLVRHCALLDLWPGFGSPVAWGILLFSAIGPGALGDIWMQRASDKVSGSTTNVILSTEPLFAAVFAAVLLGERLGSFGYLGAGLIFLAAVLAGTSEQSNEA
mmetsp:Transcript_64801/g.163178  ORF Transcript_64801/g.163178 Transcript_64801/m.163178 type:complete len:419 (-) Transcript_64801:150-1406(-)